MSHLFRRIRVEVDPDLERMACPRCKTVGRLVMATTRTSAWAKCVECDYTALVKRETKEKPK